MDCDCKEHPRPAAKLTQKQIIYTLLSFSLFVCDLVFVLGLLLCFCFVLCVRAGLICLCGYIILIYDHITVFSRVTSWASFQIRTIVGCACTGNTGKVFPRDRLQRKPLVNDPDMHHGTCVTHVPWYACRDRLAAVAGKTFPAYPAHAHPQFYVSDKRPIGTAMYLPQ